MSDSESCSGGDVGEGRLASVSVIRDTGTKVQLTLKAEGLRKRKSFFAALVSTFKKPSEPSKLCSNAHFTEFTLTDHSLKFTLNVLNLRGNKKKKGNDRREDVFKCHIKNFPTRVNPDSATFEIMEPASGNCFILMNLIKIDNLTTNWKEFQSMNGTVDASQV